MKLLIAHAYLNGYGGGERFVLEEAKYFSKKHDVRIVTWEYEPEKTFGDFAGYKIEELNARGGSLRKMTRWATYKAGCDACSTHGFPSNFLSFRNPGTVWYCHRPDLPFQESMNPYYAMLRAFDRASVRRTGKIITNSRFSAGMIKKYYNRDAAVITPGINPREFRCGKSGDYVLLVSRISPEKNIGLAIEAMKLVPELRLVIVAGWVNRKYYRSLRVDSGKVEVLEGAPDAELKKLYSGCLCVVQSATNESFGMVPLEAMASGKPIVASDRAGFRETVTEETGFLVEPRADAFAERIRYLMDNRLAAGRMGKAGLKRSMLFAWEEKMRSMGKVLGL